MTATLPAPAERASLTFDVDELLIILAWEAKLIEMQTACAALGITRRELVDWEFAAIGEGQALAEERAAAPVEAVS